MLVPGAVSHSLDSGSMYVVIDKMNFWVHGDEQICDRISLEVIPRYVRAYTFTIVSSFTGGGSSKVSLGQHPSTGTKSCSSSGRATTL